MAENENIYETNKIEETPTLQPENPFGISLNVFQNTNSAFLWHHYRY